MPPPEVKALEPLSLRSQLISLFLMELTIWRRDSLRAMVIVGTLISLFALISLGIFARDNGQEALGYILAGALVTSLLFGTMTEVQSRFILLRVSGLLDYYAMLPIWRYGLILAVLTASLVVSLPALLTIIFVGSRILSVPLNLHPLIWIILPLSTLPFAGIGAIVGTSTRTIRESSTINKVVLMVLGLMGTVTAPPTLLPKVVVILGRFNPGTYVASLYRQLMLGPVTGQLVLDLVALTGFTLLSFWLVRRRMNWKQH